MNDLHFAALRLPLTMDSSRTPTFLATMNNFVQTSLADIIFSGVFDRYPNLRIGTVEHELGWIPHFLDRLDFTYKQRQDNARWYHYERFELLSDAFRANVFCSFQDDELGIKERDTIGVQGIMFGSDYPHS